MSKKQEPSANAFERFCAKDPSLHLPNHTWKGLRPWQRDAAASVIAVLNNHGAGEGKTLLLTMLLRYDHAGMPSN